MALSYRFSRSLVEFTFTGSTASRNIFETFQKAYEDPLCPKEANLLIDTRGSTSRDGRSLATTKGFADFILKHPGRPRIHRVAVLVPDDVLSRYRNLTDTMQEETSLPIRLFSDEKGARDWLGDGTS
jgi:hypothetical protein